MKDLRVTFCRSGGIFEGREIGAPPPFFEESAGSGAKVLLLGYEAVDGFVGEKISMIPRPAKTTDPGVTLLWVLGAERDRDS